MAEFLLHVVGLRFLLSFILCLQFNNFKLVIMASRSRLRLASCDILWRVMWATLVFIVGILLTSAFVTAHWVETRAISPIPEYRHISLGLIYACFHRFDRDEICGQYGRLPFSLFLYLTIMLWHESF